MRTTFSLKNAAFFIVGLGLVTCIAFAAELITLVETTPGQWINWVAISNDGTTVAAATYKPNKIDNYEFFLMSNSGEIKFKDTFENYLGGAFWVAVSANGNRSAVGGLKKRSDNSEVGFVRAYDNTTVALDYETQGRVNALALSSNGILLIVGAGSRNTESEVLLLFKLVNAQFVKVDSVVRPKGCRSIAFSDEGTTAVCGRFDGVVEVFQISDFKFNSIMEYKLEPFTDKTSVRFVNISPNGKWIVASGNNGFFYLFNGQRLKINKAPEWSVQSNAGTEVYGVSVSSDGKFVAAGSSNGELSGNGKNSLQVIENNCSESACTPLDYWTIEPDRAPNPGMMFDGSGRWLTLATGFPVGTKSSFYLFDIKNKKIAFRHVTSDMNWPLSISRDGKYIAGGSDDSRVYLFQNEYLNGN